MRALLLAGLLTTLALSTGRAADLEAEARALEAALMAPCCYSQQVSVHQSDAAGQVRQDVRARLARGQTRQQILDAYVEAYGKRILAVPPAAGFDLGLYVLPVVLFFASLTGVGLLVRRLAGQHQAAAVAASGPASDLDRRIDDALRDLD